LPSKKRIKGLRYKKGIEMSAAEKTQNVPLPIFKVRGESLDLGCGNKKLFGSFGVEYLKTECADLQWDVQKTLPKKFWNRFALVYSAGVIDHLGNPQKFLENCKTYAKPGGFVQVIVDNGDYWRFHKKGWPFGNYHSALWFKEAKDLVVQHKMIFQLGHLETLFRLAGLQIVEKSYFWGQNIDFLLPKHLGKAYISIVGKKAK